jgi:phosphatidylglycerophosphatase A
MTPSRLRIVTSFGFVGLMRPAPGTWGSLAALVIGVVILRYAGFPALVLATLAVTALGFWACQQALAAFPGEDPGEIVIDEVAGQWIALLFPGCIFWLNGWQDWLPWPAWLAAFLFFRLFDVLKPGPIGAADRRGDPAGVMLDDILAGIIGGIATLAAAALVHALLAL